jgi:tRNA-splicing ligase RtcB
MSFMQQVQKVSDAHYVLPKAGDMRTEVHAYLSETLFEQTDEKLWAQAAQAACYPGMIGLYLMPDTHLGYGIPVGGVAVTEDVIIQAGSGYDISCGGCCRLGQAPSLDQRCRVAHCDGHRIASPRAHATPGRVGD